MPLHPLEARKNIDRSKGPLAFQNEEHKSRKFSEDKITCSQDHMITRTPEERGWKQNDHPNYQRIEEKGAVVEHQENLPPFLLPLDAIDWSWHCCDNTEEKGEMVQE